MLCNQEGPCSCCLAAFCCRTQSEWGKFQWLPSGTRGGDSFIVFSVKSSTALQSSKLLDLVGVWSCAGILDCVAQVDVAQPRMANSLWLFCFGEKASLLLCSVRCCAAPQGRQLVAIVLW